MRVGVFGGSFNPPHVGHAMVCAWLRWTDQVDAVWLVPVGVHAFGKQLPPLADRLTWCRAMANDLGPWVAVSDVEADLPAPNYTVHTLDTLAARHPGVTLRLVMGADQWSVRSSWRAWAKIESTYSPIVVGRAGHGEHEGAPTFPEISSTAIRARRAAGESVKGWVTEGVSRAWAPKP